MSGTYETGYIPSTPLTMMEILTRIVYTLLVVLSLVAAFMVVRFWQDWLSTPEIESLGYPEPQVKEWVAYDYGIRGSGHEFYVSTSQACAALMTGNTIIGPTKGSCK